MGRKEGRVFRNNYKGHRDKTKGGGIGKEVGMAGVGGGAVEGIGRQLYLNNSNI